MKAVPVAVPGRDDAFKDARTKCAATLAEATKHLEATAKEQARVEALIKAPLTTGYTPRALQFPRAKTTYRDVPLNSPYSKVSTGRRLALARWIVNRRNPLAARVAVNHVSARHFGEPLVGSMSDFGLRTPRPPLADVLDWLAVELIDSGWSLKHLHRLIVTSQAYRMRSSDSGTDDPNARRDPDNRYAWRMNSRRMEGEVIRDSVLYLSGASTRRSAARTSRSSSPSRGPAGRFTIGRPATNASRCCPPSTRPTSRNATDVTRRSFPSSRWP